MIPTTGRIVILKLTEAQKKELVDNHLSGVEEAPAIIVKHWGTNENPGACNLKVFGDSQKDIWVTSVLEGTEPGNWHWPSRV